jgi:hypothetical protein
MRPQVNNDLFSKISTIPPLTAPHHKMANKNNKNTPKYTARGRPPSHKRTKVIVEPEKSRPKPRPRVLRPPPKKSSEDASTAGLPANDDDGHGDSSHDNKLYAASVALLGLAQGGGKKISRSHSESILTVVTENSHENDKVEVVVDNVDGGSTQGNGEDEDSEQSSDEEEAHEGALSSCLDSQGSVRY